MPSADFCLPLALQTCASWPPCTVAGQSLQTSIGIHQPLLERQAGEKGVGSRNLLYLPHLGYVIILPQLEWSRATGSKIQVLSFYAPNFRHWPLASKASKASFIPASSEFLCSFPNYSLKVFTIFIFIIMFWNYVWICLARSF